ncbi:NAD(P)/FAD-dependent oxidoreductase [Cypionkella sp.]|uniref:NAD(P)/FAD-dependent oxidoreductase n=1 Tax=Cypionkella sp. TaxID=2811411 RepID=UPI0026206852|nr:NAD(P)/FAD-dependent oxidoreductase [Cypionkella sp.]MDB5667033.1 NAD(P)-binding family protein [Cypionkella sp.]
MRSQAAKYGVKFRLGHVETLVKPRDSFLLSLSENDVLSAKSVLLATGVHNHRPIMSDSEHDSAVERGLLRYCPVCDAYEITGRRIGVIGTGDKGVNESVFLRSFTDDITLMSPAEGHDLSPEHRARLDAFGIKTISGPIAGYEYDEDFIIVTTGKGKVSFNSVYAALGSDVRSELTEMLGAKRTEEGCVIVDRHQRTNIPGLYAAGDVVLGLDQISHAMGQASVAATAIRNDLFETSLGGADTYPSDLKRSAMSR